MGWFRRRGKSQLPPFVQSCDIYYRPPRLFVASRHRDTTGFMPLGQPLAVMNIDASDENIGNAVLTSLAKSRDCLNEHEATSETATAMRAVGEKGWDSLERRWQMMTAYAKDGEVVMLPMRRALRGGFVRFIEDPEYTTLPDATLVGAAIRRIIETGFPEAFIEED